ncbi:hypothetical protein [Enterococcus sp. DIV0724b]|uniref:hypothetical protein n=1 Tax=Enterococcus sp. DIV0724b TaxID=2774694 RepID=UPI003D2FB783
MKKTAKKVWNGAKQVAKKVWNGVKKVASAVWNGAKAVWNAVVPSSPRASSSWGGIASGVRYVGNYVGRTYYPQRSYVGVNYIRGRNGQPVGYQTYSQALYYQSAAYRYQVQVARAQATRAAATVRIKKVCDTADKKWTGKKSSEEQLKEFEKKYGKFKIIKNEVLFIPGGGAIGLLGKAKNTLDWAKNAIGIGKIFASVGEMGGNLREDNSTKNKSKEQETDKALEQGMNKSSYKTNTNIDCEEIAEDLVEINRNGKVYNITSKDGGQVSIPEYGQIEQFDYHFVYSYNNMIYDPRYSSVPVSKDMYFKEINSLNPQGINVFEAKL